MRVWFSGKTTAFQAVVGGSIPLTRTNRQAANAKALAAFAVCSEVRGIESRSLM